MPFPPQISPLPRTAETDRVKLLVPPSNVMARYRVSEIPLSVFSHHKENQYKVYGVSLVFHNERYRILSLGSRELREWV